MTVERYNVLESFWIPVVAWVFFSSFAPPRMVYRIQMARYREMFLNKPFALPMLKLLERSRKPTAKKLRTNSLENTTGMFKSSIVLVSWIQCLVFLSVLYSYTEKDRAAIGRYAVQHGVTAASQYFTRKLKMPVNKSTVHYIKQSYVESIKRARKKKFQKCFPPRNEVVICY